MKKSVIINACRLVLLFSALLFPGQSLAADPSLIVADYAWTSDVVALEPTDRLPSKVALQPLYLWLRIKGDAAALRMLEQNRMLPIRCRWTHYVGSRIEPDSFGTLVDEITVGVGTMDLLNKLSLEVQNKPDHNFDWRTWSMKNNTRYGAWKVDVVYSDAARTPLLCSSPRDGKPIPCSFEIRVH